MGSTIYNAHRWMFLFMFICLLFSCSKDPLSIKDIPFEDLQSSFYELNEGSFELSEANIFNDVTFLNDSTILLSKAYAEAANLRVDNILVGDMSLSGPDYFVGRILSIEDQGDQLEISTTYATMIEAYREFYFDSRKPNVVGVRKTVDLSAAFPKSVLDFFVGLLNEPLSNANLGMNLELSGKLNGTLAHPHTAYRVFGPCDGSQKCFDDLNQTDSNNNKIIDVVENHYGVTNLITNIGFYTVEIEDFKIEELDFEVKIGSSNLDELDYNIQDSPDFVLGDVSNKPKGTLGANRPFNIYYIPAFTVGAVGFFIPVAPVLEIDFEASCYASLENEFPNAVDINIGHVDWRNTIPSVEETFLCKQGDDVVPITKIFEGFTSSVFFGADGKLEKKIGLAIGAAVSSGEPNKAGISAGGLISMGMYNSFEGSLALKIPNVKSFAIDESTVSGSVCFDMGLTWDTHLFVDDNLASNVFGDIFDLKYTIPKENLGFEDISLFDYVDLPSDADDVCFSFNECINSTVAYLHLGANENDDPVAEFKVLNENVPSQSYNIIFTYQDVNGQAQSTSLEGLNFGEDVRKVLPNLAWPNLYAAYIEDELDVSIEIPDLDCEEKSSAIATSFSLNCDNPFVDEIDTNEFEFIIRNDVAGNEIVYMQFADAQTHVGTLQNKKIPTLSELELFLSELECNNPTGVYLPPSTEGDDYRFTNGHLSYFWVSEQGDETGSVSIAKVAYLTTIGGTAFSSIEIDYTHPLTSFVALIPIDNQ